MVAQTQIARPYARAAFEYAVEHQELSTWAEMLQFAALAVSYSEVRAFLMDPRVTVEQAYQLIVDICGKELQPQLRNYLQFLAHNQRLLILPEIVYLFELYKAERERTIKVQISSAFPVTQEQLNKIAKALELRLQRKIHLEYETDKTLIGGMIIRAPDLDWVFDGSMKTKLSRLANTLRV